MESYLELDHPLQQEILKTLADFSDLRPDQITIGIDGCSAPNFALPLYNAALAFARLAGPVRMSERRTAACHTITHAMMQHPTMIAGSGEFDTRLMEVGAGRWVSKGGAEGYQGIGLLPRVLGVDSPGIGIALKISDGSLRDLARSAVALEILRQLGVLSEADLQQLENFGPRIRLKNFRGLQVGDTAPCFDIRTTR